MFSLLSNSVHLQPRSTNSPKEASEEVQTARPDEPQMCVYVLWGWLVELFGLLVEMVLLVDSIFL